MHKATVFSIIATLSKRFIFKNLAQVP